MRTEKGSSDIRITRIYDAPLSAVWHAWTDLDQVSKWWGPRGFTITTHSKDLRPGGTWRYTMHGPDGVDYPNVATYHVVEPYKRLEYDHGATDERPALFRVNVTFAESDGRTTMEMTMTLESPEAAATTAKFVRQVGGNSTWDRLAEHLDATFSGRPTFVINRTFEAPIERMFAMWTTPGHLVRWLPPAGTTMRFERAEIAVGKSTFFVISGAFGDMYVRAEYLEIEPPRRIVYLQQFVDEREQLAAAPGADVWPPTLRNTVVLSEEAPGFTRVTVTTEPVGSCTATELAAFVAERTGMTRGWTGSFDVLEAVFA
jgi:uncharacterized protein YndB with AHSA1/START domain